MGKPTTKMVKSAQRVMEVLEFFSAERTDATVMDLVRVLDYPQSSASELLRCLVSLGYLDYDRYQRTYRLTARVPLLGSWVYPSLFRNGSLLATMDILAEKTGEAVVLASIDSFALRYLHVVPGKRGPTPLKVGSRHSPFYSALGRTIASHWHDRLCQDVVRRLNADEPLEERRLRASDVVADLHDVALAGYAKTTDEAHQRVGMVAISIPGAPSLAVGIPCPSASPSQDYDYLASLLLEAFSLAPEDDARQLDSEKLETADARAWPSTRLTKVPSVANNGGLGPRDQIAPAGPPSARFGTRSPLFANSYSAAS